MSLRNYVVPKDNVKVPGNDDLVVRGLSLEDLSPLLTSYRPQLLQIWKQIEAVREGKTLGDIDMTEALQIALAICPPLVAGLIASAADEPDMAANARLLPLSTQVEAVTVISNLTFEQNGGSTKFWEAVIKMITGAASLAKPQIAAAVQSRARRNG